VSVDVELPGLELDLPQRACAWCSGPLPAGCRSDTITCSKRCRQARHRFNRGVGSAPDRLAGAPRRLAYADPPYPGLSRRYYSEHLDFAGEVDHAELIRRLSIEYDAWALSTSAAALRDILLLCPSGVRVAAWVRGERPNAQATVPLSSWEPVILGGALGRLPSTRDSYELRRVDSLVYHSRPRLTEAGRVIGSKPAAFWGWLFDLLGADPVDEFTDLFPGSRAGARAWSAYTRRAAIAGAS
jgi:hypothetical protein